MNINVAGNSEKALTRCPNYSHGYRKCQLYRHFFSPIAMIAETILLLFSAGCSSAAGKADMGQYANAGQPDIAEQSGNMESFKDMGRFAQEPETKPLKAESGLELAPGVTVEGIFDRSRERIQIRCEEEAGEIALYLGGEKALSVPEGKTVLLYDMNEEDASLELVVGEKATVEIESISAITEENLIKETELWKITAYQVHPDGLTEIPLLPAGGEDNSFFIKDWYQLSFRHEFVELYLYDTDGSLCSHIYQLMPEGCLASYKEKQAAITMDGEVLILPANQVGIYYNTSLGIAFQDIEGMNNTVHYNVYQSKDGGISWSLVVEDYTASGSLERIYILDENTIVCCFDISGFTDDYWSYIVSEDGGMTWEDNLSVEWMERYRYLRDTWK